ncbi:MAG: transglutaminase [Microbacterium sp. SCN 70-200]|uniref:transglutaminase family protein n=1 Tax=unclassified Microbacterium TaxID=2609290 RepID=UPI00086AA0E0|nr:MULTISPECIES: DUF3488 and transglutaminase-like domain-containing protein [unclassified Microbacterium]ODT42295.1 MAG: transglutaminase [Microbacterium sp. SCN 70-200]OJV79278.1 MAG: transglutaminase [Microbacterium sp. 70-16]
MSASEAAPRQKRPRGEVRLTIALWIAIVAVIVPLLRVVAGGPWLLGVTLLPAALLGIGFGLRRLRAPAIGVTLVELAVWVGTVTAFFLPTASFLGVIPTGAAIAEVPRLVEVASGEIFLGVAPLEPTLALSFVIVASLGLLTVALDHVVLTARMPLLAAAALVMVWLIPSIAVPADIDVFAFVLLAASLLYLIRAETRTREATVMAARSRGVMAVATAIGAVAIVGALVVGPALPPPTIAAAGSGVAASIDASLDLGRDLRRRSDVTVLTMRSDAPQLPNLRVATLSVFDGDVWLPDRMRSMSATEVVFDPVAVTEGIRVTEYRTNVEVAQLSSAYLPISYPAVEITGLEGIWRTVPYSRTIVSGQSNAQGQSYEVVSHVPRPTLEQIRAAQTTTRSSVVDVFSLPEGTPAVIGELAQEVTADAATDYDKLVALQSWFRGPEFTYSLSTPVADGFDGTGVDAVATFLDVKEGYCIHFASAFALMARSLGMPSRVVVGFLPGDYTGDTVDGERVAEVTTGQLHAWPEVEFDGIGWVAFEPTKSLGAPTTFSSAASPVDESGEDVTDATIAPTPTTTSTATADERPADAQDEASGTSVRLVDLRPYLAVVGTLLVLAFAPGAAAALRRQLLRRRGTVAAAWRLVQDTAIDLGVAVPGAESPRAFGARLMATHDAPHTETARLVAAVERASYADAATATDAAARGAQAVADAEGIRREMLAALTGSERVRALALPRSLVIRPGSAFADRDQLA